MLNKGPHRSSSRLWSTTAWIVGLLCAMLFGYHGVARATNPVRVVSLMTPLDAAIPFVPQSIFAYSLVYCCALYPLFVVRHWALFDALVRAYAWLLGLSFAIFLAFPVSSAPLRPDFATLDLATFSGWGTRLTYHVDPPTNCFPSMHLSFAVLAMLSAWTIRPAWGQFALPMVLGIAVSICTMKQHYVADGVGALVLAVPLWRRYLVRAAATIGPGERVAASWRGPAAFALVVAMFFAAFYSAFVCGWQPWAHLP